MFQDYWLRWSSTRVSLGKGLAEGKNTLMEVNTESDQAFEMGGVSFKTGAGIKGEWEILEEACKFECWRVNGECR